MKRGMQRGWTDPLRNLQTRRWVSGSEAPLGCRSPNHLSFVTALIVNTVTGTSLNKKSESTEPMDKAHNFPLEIFRVNPSGFRSTVTGERNPLGFGERSAPAGHSTSKTAERSFPGLRSSVRLPPADGRKQQLMPRLARPPSFSH